MSGFSEWFVSSPRGGLRVGQEVSQRGAVEISIGGIDMERKYQTIQDDHTQET